MRRFIIDTDTGSDDAVALILALKANEVKIEAVTTVSGNCHLDKATQNALMTIEVVDRDYPKVYKGCEKPLKRALVTADNVHGEDGMGDIGLIHPRTAAQPGDAVDVILETVKQYPGEIELIVIGPATNIAGAIIKDRKTMEQVKHIYSMGTAGFGPGNTTPVSEFNVYVDAESYEIMLGLDVPTTIVGFDVCFGESALTQAEIELVRNSGVPEAKFAMDCNKTLLEYNLQNTGGIFMDLPDVVAMAVCLWEDIVLERVDCYLYVCTTEEVTYGQVIPYEGTRRVLLTEYDQLPPNASVIKQIDIQEMKRRVIGVLMQA